MFAFHNSHSLVTPFGAAVVTLVEMGTIGFCICLLTGQQGHPVLRQGVGRPLGVVQAVIKLDCP